MRLPTTASTPWDEKKITYVNFTFRMKSTKGVQQIKHIFTKSRTEIREKFKRHIRNLPISPDLDPENIPADSWEFEQNATHHKLIANMLLNFVVKITVRAFVCESGILKMVKILTHRVVFVVQKKTHLKTFL